MFEQAFKNIDDVLWKEAGCASELDYIEQTSWLLFLRYLDALEQDRADEAALEGKKYSFILKLLLHEPLGIQTTSITVHEEGKTDRGALKVVSREILEDGRFRIIYRGDFRDDSFADVATDWLKKHGERRRA